MPAEHGGAERPKEKQAYPRAAKMNFDVDELELFPYDSSRAMVSADKQDAKAEVQETTMNNQDFMQHEEEKKLLQHDEHELLPNRHSGFEGSSHVQWTSDLPDQMGALLECGRNADRENAVKDIVDAYLAADDDLPDGKTYRQAVKRGGCEWRRKREEEKAVARRIFKSPLDWNDATKMRTFLKESRRIWE
ncbi:hypothetical protein OHC33_010604 [Knufia fluminis]|uniref:Uncharacterized protein n=1 Tax=Knufia fluminis TaxID=191047 RepID=A0AAN8E9H4_9EURO|nr:hypothetical protein OHC33_010604 [Knufia fluminis]